jgi:hypothetical protein
LVAALAERFNAALIGVSAWPPTRPMRHRDPHDDPPAKRCPEPYRGQPVTLGHMRAHTDEQLRARVRASLLRRSA